jgi:hypothetical protein
MTLGFAAAICWAAAECLKLPREQTSARAPPIGTARWTERFVCCESGPDLLGLALALPPRHSRMVAYDKIDKERVV